MRASDNVHAPGSVGLGFAAGGGQWPCSPHMAGAFPWPWTAQLADQWFTDLRTEGLDATQLPEAPRLAASRPSAGRTCSTTGSAGGYAGAGTTPAGILLPVPFSCARPESRPVTGHARGIVADVNGAVNM